MEATAYGMSKADTVMTVAVKMLKRKTEVMTQVIIKHFRVAALTNSLESSSG